MDSPNNYDVFYYCDNFLQKVLDFSHHSHVLIQGFRDMYKFLMSHREHLLAADGPLSVFKRLPSRFLFRATSIYGQLLENSYRPDLLRDDVERDI
jgi:lantibiotic modifying enzyme